MERNAPGKENKKIRREEKERRKENRQSSLENWFAVAFTATAIAAVRQPTHVVYVPLD